MRKGRMLKIRFAPIAAAIKVKNLTPFVSNELLEYAFSIFGEVCNYIFHILLNIKLIKYLFRLNVVKLWLMKEEILLVKELLNFLVKMQQAMH